jgi:hypothetical protein
MSLIATGWQVAIKKLMEVRNIYAHTYNHHLKRNIYFHLSYILLQHVSASLGHHQECTLLLKLLHYQLSMSSVNTLFLILKSSKVDKIADSAAPAFGCQLWVFYLWHWSVDSIYLLS